MAYSPPSCGVSKGCDRPREDGQRWQVQLTDGAVGDAAAGPIVALAMAGRTQHRCRCKSLVMASTTQRTIVVGRFDWGASRAVRSRSVTALAGWRLTPSRRWRWRAGHRIDVGVRALYGAFDVKRFSIQLFHIANPYVRSAGPSLRPDHERGRTRGWVEVKDGPQGHRRRRRPASLRSAHPRVTLGWLGWGPDDWPAWWVSRSKAEFSRPWTAARSNNLVFGPARSRRP